MLIALLMYNLHNNVMIVCAWCRLKTALNLYYANSGYAIERDDHRSIKLRDRIRNCRSVCDNRGPRGYIRGFPDGKGVPHPNFKEKGAFSDQ